MSLPPVLPDAAFKEAAQLIREFSGNFSSLTSSIVGILTANTQAFAAENLYKLKDKLDAKNSVRESKGLEPIPLRLAIPMLSRIALESDDKMLDLWANLISNFQVGDESIKPNRIFIHILSEMEPLDAQVLQHAAYCNSNFSDSQPREMQISYFSSSINCSEDKVLLSFYNLSRLGCFWMFSKGTPIQSIITSGIFKAGDLKIEVDQVEMDKYMKRNRPTKHIFSGTDASFLMTHLGNEMLKACSIPNSPR